jgi:glyoxylase-like metal-dependent hydrolase (beta-lactamase superfamily II)
VTEADLRDLGVRRIPVPIPFPQAGGPVNVYLVERADGRFLQFDSGLGTPEAQAALEAGFAREGIGFDRVERIVVSHGHVDHYGAARFVQERHAAAGGGSLPVYAHPADIPKMTEGGRRWKEQLPHYAAYLRRLGVPDDTLAAIAREGEKGLGLSRRLAEVHPVGEGEVLRCRHLDLEVLHMPGHTPGLVVLWDARHRLVLSDDHLLERVSPNPLIELGPDGEEGFFRPLLAYVASIRRLQALPVETVLPGHGPPFGGHVRTIDSLLGFYAKRQQRIRELLAKGPLSGHGVALALFPWAKPGDLFLVLSETVANLELLEARGEAARELDGGTYRFRLLG